MAWRAIPGFLFKDFWFPFVASNIVKPVPAPTEDCKALCAGVPDCCRWAVRDVRSWDDAKDADSGFSEVGWTIAGEDINGFGSIEWCFDDACAGQDNTFKIEADTTTAGWPKMKFTTTFETTTASFDLVNLPGQSGASSFYALLLLTNKGFYVYDKNGVLQKHFPQKTRQDALVTLAKLDPAMVTGVTFVSSYSCGLFKKEASVARLTVEALPGKLGLLGRCGAEKWSDEAWAGSHGISFASLACAVIASVALVFVVLFVTKKTSHLEVALADE